MPTELELPLPAVPGVKALPLVATCQWSPFPAVKPGPDEVGNWLCIATPDSKHSPQQVAEFNGVDWLDTNEDFILDKVTFWCVLPASPEHMAENPKAEV